MPKRGAEKELNKDNADREDEDETPSTGFVRANDEEISRRRIVGLPRRAQFAAKIASPNTAPGPQFSGLSTPSNAMFTSNGTAQTVAPTATSTAKSFASFLQPSSSSSSPTPSQVPESSARPILLSTPTQEDDPSITKYYTSLRGLNVSLLEAVTSAIEDDTFADISNFLERYNNLRLGIQKEFDDNKKLTPPAPAKPLFTPAVFTPAPPVPPSGGFKGFGSLVPTSSASSSSTGPLNNGSGFKPQPTAPSTSGFSFALAPTNAPANPFSLTPTTGSPFGSSTPSSSNPAPEKVSSDSSPFSLKPSAAADKSVPSSSSFTFGSFSASGTKAPSSSFSFGTTTAKASSFTFGTTSGSVPTPSFGTTGTSLFGSISASSNSSGSGDSENAPSFGLFGKPPGSAGSIGNPVGFTFGASSKTPDAPANPESSSAQKEGDEAQEGQADSVAAEGSKGLITKNPYDDEGEGEQDEETIHGVRAKVYRLAKGEAGTSWADLGVGIFRIKKHKETGSQRILLRNSGTGRIILNFRLYSGLKPIQNKKSLTFVGHDEVGASQTYNVRLQGEEPATALREALEREVASL